MRFFISVFSFIVMCYMNICYAVQYTIPDTKIIVDIPEKYKVITIHDSERLVDFLDEIYNVGHNRNINKEDLEEEAKNLIRGFQFENNKLIGINKDNLFRFVINYKPVEENIFTNMIVDFKILKSKSSMKKACEMFALGYDVKDVNKTIINNQSFLVVDSSNKELYLKSYLSFKKDFVLGIVGGTSKKHLEEDSIALKRIVSGIDFPEDSCERNNLALDKYRWTYLDKTNNANIYVDFDSIHINNKKEVDMWIAFEMEKETIICLDRYYLEDRQRANLSYVKYDNITGNAIDSYSFKYYDKKHIIPGSVMEMLYDFAGTYYLLNNI